MWCDQPFCNLDGLRMYGTGTISASGRRCLAPKRSGVDGLAKQADPTTKRHYLAHSAGRYSITQAMERFIPGMYEETAIPGRVQLYWRRDNRRRYCVRRGLVPCIPTTPMTHAATSWSTRSTWCDSHMFGDQDNGAKKEPPGLPLLWP